MKREANTAIRCDPSKLRITIERGSDVFLGKQKAAHL